MNVYDQLREPTRDAFLMKIALLKATAAFTFRNACSFLVSNFSLNFLYYMISLVIYASFYSSLIIFPVLKSTSILPFIDLLNEFSFCFNRLVLNISMIGILKESIDYSRCVNWTLTFAIPSRA